MALGSQARRTAGRLARGPARRLARGPAGRLARRTAGRLARRPARRLARRPARRTAWRLALAAKNHSILLIDTSSLGDIRTVKCLRNAAAVVDHRLGVHANNTFHRRIRPQRINAAIHLLQLHLQLARLNVLGLHANLAQRQREARDDHAGRLLHVHKLAARRSGATRRPPGRPTRGRRPAASRATHQEAGVHLTTVQAVRGPARRATGGAARRPTGRPARRPTRRPTRRPARRTASGPTTRRRRFSSKTRHGRGVCLLIPKEKKVRSLKMLNKYCPFA